jgi:hypothetical protein
VKVLQVILVRSIQSSQDVLIMYHFFSKHPSYDDRYLLNDIAVLKLEDYLRPSATIQFACLPYLLSQVNTTCMVVGFGDTFPGANQGKIC